MVEGIHHIELNISDLEESFRFYSSLSSFLGGSIELVNGSFLWSFDSFYIYCNQVKEQFSEIKYHRKRVGLDHLAFKLVSIDEIIRLKTFFTDNGISILYDAGYYGEKYFAIFIEDPDRIKLEFGVNVI